MPAPRKKRLTILTLYLLVMGTVVVSVLLFCLLYGGTGAHTLNEPVSTENLDADEQPEETVQPAAALVEITPDITPEQTPKPAAVYRDGRFLAYLDNGLWGYKNMYGVTVIEPRFTAANEFEEDVAFAAQNGQYVLIGRNGEYIVMPSWDAVGAFSDGMAAVMVNNRWGYINTSGELVIDYRFYDAQEFGCGRAAVRTSGPWGYIDVQGNLAISAKWRAAGKFSGDVAFVTSDEYEKDRFYMIDKVGEKIVTFGSSEKGTVYSEGFAVIIAADRYYYINNTGASAFKQTFERARAFSDGLAAVRENSLWGFISDKGVYVIEPAYGDAGSFSEGYAAVQDKATGLWGYISTKGEWLIEPAYDSAGEFSGGVAVVETGGKYYILNAEGSTVVLY